MSLSLGFKMIGLASMRKTLGASKGNLNRGIRQDFNVIGELLIGEIQKHIIGARASNPPELLGRVNSRLAQSFGKEVKQKGGVIQLIVGTSVEYARIHEFGGRAGRGLSVTIPARPYAQPSIEAKQDEITEILGDRLVTVWVG
jgi:hypothetical protein